MAPTTRVSLIARLRESDDVEAWSEFVAIYGPLIYHYGNRKGLQNADACDLTQEVLREVLKSIDRFDYDPRLGRFRGWLRVVTRRALARMLEKQRQETLGNGDTATHQTIANVADEGEDLWEREHRMHLLRWAANAIRDEFKESTWQAFLLTAVDGRRPQEVAERTGLSVGAVYVAKSRVMNRLREKIQLVEESQ